jgi:general secretion pathway protein B
MSYILDALKRADAERERGAVPGLHAQPAAMALPDDGAHRPLPPWAWGVGGLVVALAGMLAWSLWSGSETPPPGEAPQMAQGGPGAWNPSEQGATPQAHRASGAWPGPQGGMRPMHEGGPALGGPGMAPTTEGSAGQRPHRPGMHEPRTEQGGAPTGTDRRQAMAQHDPASAGQMRPARPDREQDHTPNSEGTVKPGGTASTPSSTSATVNQAPTAEASAAASTRVYALHELPDHVRRSLPQLVIGGAMYSDNPGSRMLVINSQLFHEGDKLGPDLTLEEIKLKSAVLRYRSWRYGVTY